MYLPISLATIHRWFFGSIKRMDAEKKLLLSQNEHGSFLIRESESRVGDYSLSGKHLHDQNDECFISTSNFSFQCLVLLCFLTPPPPHRMFCMNAPTVRWYFGRCKRTEAEKFLDKDGNDHGAFLLRKSESSVNDHSLSGNPIKQNQNNPCQIEAMLASIMATVLKSRNLDLPLYSGCRVSASPRIAMISDFHVVLAGTLCI